MGIRILIVPLEKLLSEEYAVLRASLVDMSAASISPRPGDPSI